MLSFRWSSLRNMRMHPKGSSLVMLATVAVTVATHDLAQGVLVGVLLSGIFFVRKVAGLFSIRSDLSADGTMRTYVVTGQVFFASAEAFVEAFDFRDAVERVTIDVSGSHIWDLTAVAALDRVVLKLRREGTDVEIVGMNAASTTLVDRLATHDKPGSLERLASH